MTEPLSRLSPGIVERLTFGQPVENIAASEDNPTKRGFFVRNSGSMVEYASPRGVHYTPADNIRALCGDDAQPPAEPIAWRYQRKEGWEGIWRYSSLPITDQDFETPDDWVTEPLYAVPSSPAADGALSKIAELTNVGRGDVLSLQDALHAIHKVATDALSMTSTQPLPPKPEPTRWPTKGDMMKFLGQNGYDFEREAALKIFSIGQELLVEDCNVWNWEHSVKFVGTPGWYNGVMFERVAVTRPHLCTPREDK